MGYLGWAPRGLVGKRVAKAALYLYDLLGNRILHGIFSVLSFRKKEPKKLRCTLPYPIGFFYASQNAKNCRISSAGSELANFFNAFCLHKKSDKVRRVLFFQFKIRNQSLNLPFTVAQWVGRPRAVWTASCAIRYARAFAGLAQACGWRPWCPFLGKQKSDKRIAAIAAIDLT